MRSRRGAFPSGWLHDDAFADCMRRWQLEAITNPSDQAQPDPETEMREAARRIGNPMLRRVPLDRFAGTGAFKRFALRLDLDLDRLRDRVLRDHGTEPWTDPEEETPIPPL